MWSAKYDDSLFVEYRNLFSHIMSKTNKFNAKRKLPADLPPDVHRGVQLSLGSAIPDSIQSTLRNHAHGVQATNLVQHRELGYVEIIPTLKTSTNLCLVPLACHCQVYMPHIHRMKARPDHLPQRWQWHPAQGKLSWESFCSSYLSPPTFLKYAWGLWATQFLKWPETCPRYLLLHVCSAPVRNIILHLRNDKIVCRLLL